MMADYEAQREARIASNRRKFEELGMVTAVADMNAAAKKEDKAPREKKAKVVVPPEEVRRSGRPRTEVSYAELEGFPALPRDPRPRVARTLDEAEVEALRQKNGAAVGADDEAGPSTSSQAEGKKGRGPVDSGKGVRIQGGKVYDSKFGVTCHWCRQKTLEDHVTCSHPNCSRNGKLPTSFCKNCLRNRHGEDYEAALKTDSWVCPPCRGSCGTGCVTCCNCGPCRKKAGLDPTHQVLKLARDAGFNNVHDYLVHLVTGETLEELTERKKGFEWGAWLGGPGCSTVGLKPAAGAAAKAAAAEAKEVAKPKKRYQRRKKSVAAQEGEGEEQQEGDEEEEGAKPKKRANRRKKSEAAQEEEGEEEQQQEGAKEEEEAAPAAAAEEEQDDVPARPTRKQRMMLKLGLM